MLEISRATKIQRVWRGHKGRKSAFRARINAKLGREYTRLGHRHWGAIHLQRLFRGYSYRKSKVALMLKQMCTKIQALWRGRACRKLLQKNEEKRLAAKFLCHVLYGFALKLRNANHKRQNAMQGHHAYTINKTARRYVNSYCILFWST